MKMKLKRNDPCFLPENNCSKTRLKEIIRIITFLLRVSSKLLNSNKTKRLIDTIASGNGYGWKMGK